MKKTLMFLALASVGLASCNGGFKKGDGGMLYQIYAGKGGPTIQPGDFASVDLIIKTDADSVLRNTYSTGPIATIIPKSQSPGDIISGLLKLSEGDSAVIKVSADSIFKKGPKPPGFKGNYLVYDVKVEKVIPKGNLSDEVFHGRITAYMQGLEESMKNAEQVKIKNYITNQKLNVIRTPDSLQYVVTQQGTGPNPAVGDTVVLNYTGRLLNGKVFDSSIKDTVVKNKLEVNPMRQYQPVHIPVGEKKVIPGWDEGLMLLNKGSKATLIIPSSLAYGGQGAGDLIGPYTTLVFDVEITDIIKPNPNAPKPINPLTLKVPTKTK